MMGPARKARAVHATLVVLTLWPLLHLWLVARFDISSWKLAGWGMYATPRLQRVGLEIFGLVRDTGARERLTFLPPELRSEAVAYIERHRFLRRLARPDALAWAMLAEHPEWETIWLRVGWAELDRPTGMIVTRQLEYEY